MRQFWAKSFAAVVASASVLMCLAGTAGAKIRKSKENAAADMTVPVPRFSIAVKLSEKANQWLQSLHESIRVIAYFDGDPLPGQGRYNAPFRDVFLGNDERLVDDQNVATFEATKISQSNWNLLSSKDYFVTINVMSARKASNNNLLDCGVPEDRLSTFEGKTTEVRCSLIDEKIHENNPANPALKSLGSSPK